MGIIDEAHAPSGVPRRSFLGRVSAASFADSFVALAVSRRYLGSTGCASFNYLAAAFLDRPVALAISLQVFLSRRCTRLTLPIMSMMIALFIPSLQKAARYVEHLAQFFAAPPFMLTSPA